MPNLLGSCMLDDAQIKIQILRTVKTGTKTSYFLHEAFPDYREMLQIVMSEGHLRTEGPFENGIVSFSVARKLVFVRVEKIQAWIGRDCFGDVEKGVRGEQVVVVE